MNSLRLALGLLATVMLAGCGETPDDPVDGSYRFIHAAPDYAEINFSLENLAVASLDYGSGNGAAPLDSGPFDFNLESLNPAAAGGLAALSARVDIEAQNDHILVLYSDNNSLSLQNYVVATPETGGGDPAIRILHAAEGSPEVSVFIEPADADLLAATPVVTLSFKTLSDEVTRTAGEYELSVTAANDPQTLLFQSVAVQLNDGENLILGVLGSFGSTGAPLRASIFSRNSATPTVLTDSLSAPRLRVISAAAAGGNLDVVIGTDFTMPFQAAVAPLEVRDYADVASGAQTITVTPAGDPGVLEIEQDVTLSNAVQQTQIIGGIPGDFQSAIYFDDNRPVRARAKYRVRNATSDTLTNIFLEAPGTDITNETPVVFALLQSGPELGSTALPGDYEITVVANDNDSATTDTTIIGGPFAISLPELSVTEIVLVDAPGGGVEFLVNDLTSP